ncbi:MAG: hypothetical protein OEM59_04750 [Rhodospirillales bacterium]|nr:hypothetical protein [Rhodospirillales bacterium]
MELISRKGYRVRISHCQLPDNDSWTLKINILVKTGAGIQNLKIPYSMTFDSKEEARRHVFAYGRKIMDQESKILSAMKLLFGDEAGLPKKAADEPLSVTRETAEQEPARRVLPRAC